MGKTKRKQDPRSLADGSEGGSGRPPKARGAQPEKRAKRDRQIIAEAAYGFLYERAAQVRAGSRERLAGRRRRQSPALPGVLPLPEREAGPDGAAEADAP